MTGRPRGRAALALLAAAALAGCDTIGNPIRALTQKKPGPDEFAVVKRDGLRLPPGLGAGTLPEPKPGAPSPLDPDPEAEAVAALTGRPTPPAGEARQAVSRGEAALLAAADAAAADPDIRARIAAENETIDEAGPYDPPSIFELLSGTEALDEEDLVDPAEESRRLQAEGVPTPVNRSALERAAAEEAETRAAAVEDEAGGENTAATRPPRFRGPLPTIGRTTPSVE